MPYVSIGDINLYYHVVGDLDDTSKPTFIFLHGGAGLVDHSLYVPFWSHFLAQVNIVFIDQRACGRSDRGDPKKWTLAQYGKDVDLFCKALKIKKPIVGGVSWGGYIAMSYAIQYPNEPMALVFCNTEGRVSPSARYEAFLRIANIEAAEAVKAFDENWNLSTNEKFFKTCLPFYAKKSYTPDEFENCIQNTDLWTQYLSLEHGKFDFTPELFKICCPVLYLAGENDPVHPVSCAIETAEAIGDFCELVIIKDTGAPVYRDRPEETINIISKFFNTLY